MNIASQIFHLLLIISVTHAIILIVWIRLLKKKNPNANYKDDCQRKIIYNTCITSLERPSKSKQFKGGEKVHVETFLYVLLR